MIGRLADLILRLILPRGEAGDEIRADVEREADELAARRSASTVGAWKLLQALRLTPYLLIHRLRRRGPSRRAFALWPESVAQDARFAVRAFARSPGFAVLAIVTLGLGIGSATALFSVVEGVLLRPLPYPEPDRLVRLSEMGVEGGTTTFSNPNFRDVQERSRSFASLSAYLTGASPVSVAGHALRTTVTEVSEDFFDVVGVEPILGRGITPSEFASEAHVAVVADDFWRTELNAPRDLSGAVLRIGGEVYSVVGVLPPGGSYPASSGIWVPRDPEPLQYRTGHGWLVVGRMRPDVELDAARAELTSIAAELAQRYGDDTWMADVQLLPLREQLVGGVRRALLILLAAGGFLLVVACANVVNLLLARAAARAGESAVRRALGAGRARLLRQSLAETLLLSLAGGAIGLVSARFGVQLLLALEPGRLPRAGEVSVNGWALAFALGVSVAAAAIMALVTSTRGSDDRISEALAQSDRSRTGDTRTQRLRGSLAALQVAMTLVLLVGASLMARSVLKLLAIDPGYRTSGVVVVDAYLPYVDGDASARGIERSLDAMLAAARDVPGVTSVGVTSAFPFAGRGSSGSFLILDRPDQVRSLEDFQELARDPSHVGTASYRVASAEYFRAMGIPLLRGRLFDERDGRDGPHTAVISQSLADRRWPDEDPIGELIQYGNMDGDVRPFTIVGVVADVRERGLDTEPVPTFYGNAMQRSYALGGLFTLVLPTGEDDTRAVPAVEAALRQAVPDVPVRVRTVEEILSASLGDRRFSLLLLASFSLVAVVLAVTGIYGVISYLVRQRDREWAIRLTLGAERSDVVRRVLASGLRWVSAGVLAGSAIAFFATRLLVGQLYGVPPTDVPTFVGVALLLVVVSLLACYAPAARATRTDPLTVMRE